MGVHCELCERRRKPVAYGTMRAATNEGRKHVAKISQQDLEKRLWAAANALRGPVDPADFKTYVFPMLFWKWISDTWAHEQAEAVKEYGNELTDEIEADFHRCELPDGPCASG